MSSTVRRQVQARGQTALKKVHEAMSWPAFATGPLVWAEVALRYAELHGVRQLVVRSSSGRIGLVRVTGLRTAEPDALVLDCPVYEPLVLDPDDSVEEARLRLEASGEDCALCLWRGAVGLVTRGDLRRATYDELPRRQSGVQALLGDDDEDEDTLTTFYRDVGTHR